VSNVPRDRVLLHVGVHKTGSTALQAALADARPELKPLGVIYPGSANAHHNAARAVAERTFGFGDQAQLPQPRQWRQLCRSIRRHRGRAIVSSEFFGQMAPKNIAKVVDGLGGTRVHVLIVVRPLTELLPSSWQQYLKGGLKVGYGEWLQAILGPGHSPYTPGFWSRANFSRIIRQWTSVVPPERITAVILDPDDRQLVDRTVAELVDVPAGVISRNYEGGPSNRSLTAPEAELLRQVNLLAAGSIGWKAYSGNIRRGAVRIIVENRQPPADEPRINTPQWALDEALKRQRKDLNRLRRSGVDLRGPTRRMLEARTGADPVEVTEFPADLAAMGVASAAGWRP